MPATVADKQKGRGTESPTPFKGSMIPKDQAACRLSAEDLPVRRSLTISNETF